MNKISVPSVGLLIFFLFSVPWASEKFDISPKGNPMAARAIDEVLKEHAKAVMSIPGVVGIGQGLCKGTPCIKVFVIKKTPELDRKIPNTLEGYQVVVEETGEVRALPKN